MAIFRLHKNIRTPLDQSNQYYFGNMAERNNFFEANTQKQYDDFQFVKENFMVCIPEKWQTVYSWGIRYCSYQLDNSDKWYFAFVTRFEWASENSVNLYITLDVFQTFLFDFRFGGCLINTQHYENKNYSEIEQDAGVNNYVNNGIDIEYDMFTSSSWYIISSSCNLQTSGGTVEQPTIKTANGSSLDGGFNGCSYYLVPNGTKGAIMGIKQFFQTLKDTPWVSQCIQSVTAIPESIGDAIIADTTLNDINSIPFGSAHIYELIYAGYRTINTFTIPSVKNATLNNSDLVAKMPQLCRYPYTIIQLLLYNGNTVNLRPELFEGNEKGDKNMELAVFFHLNENPRILIVPKNYDGKLYDFENALVYADFPKFTVTVNNGLLYAAQNANQLAQQRSNYYVTSGLASQYGNMQKASVTNQKGLADFQRNMTVIGNIASGAGNLFNLNFGGVAQNAVSALTTIGSQQYYNNQTNIDKASIDLNTAITKQNVFNSYQLSVAAIKDAQITAPTVTGLSGGDAMIISPSIPIKFLSVKIKQPYSAEQKNIYNYFKNFGFKQNVIGKPNLLKRNGKIQNKMNFVKCDVANIYGNIPQSYLQQLKDIFENGITLWHVEHDMYDYNFDADD